MTGNRKSNSKKRNPRQITAHGTPDEEPALVIARTVLRPSVQAAATLTEYTKGFGDLDLSGLIESLSNQSKAVIDGDLSRAEAMLSVQAHTLDAIFNNLARRAINAEYMKNLDCYLKFALRAQSQCRATWEAVVTIKHPPVLGYVNQANIAHGPQQVNNATAPASGASRARENQNLQNELLKAKDGERLDFPEASTAGCTHPAMAAVGEIHGPKNPAG